MTRGIRRSRPSEAEKIRAMIRAALPPVLNRLYELALAGDVQAAKLLLDRSLPPLAPVKDKPSLTGKGSVHDAAVELVEKVMAGEIAAKDAAEMLEFLRQTAPNPEAKAKTIDAAKLQALRDALGAHYTQ